MKTSTPSVTRPTFVSDSPWFEDSPVPDRRPVSAHEVASIYTYPHDRYVVSMILGYSKDDDVHSVKGAATAALEYVRETTDGANVWHVYDRETGKLHSLEQREFDDKPAVEKKQSLLSFWYDKGTHQGDLAAALRDIATLVDQGEVCGELSLICGGWEITQKESDEDRTVYVAGFCPGVDGGGDGGFEWRRTIPEIKTVISEWLERDLELMSDYIIRSVRIPKDVNLNDRDAVTEWLDGDGFELWNTQAQHAE